MSAGGEASACIGHGWEEREGTGEGGCDPMYPGSVGDNAAGEGGSDPMERSWEEGMGSGEAGGEGDRLVRSMTMSETTSATATGTMPAAPVPSG